MPENQEQNKILKRVKRLLFTKDAFIFLFFLDLAGAFWFVHSLDQQRQTVLRIPIDYMGIPEDVELVKELPSRIDVTIRDEGLMLLKYNKSNTVPLH